MRILLLILFALPLSAVTAADTVPLVQPINVSLKKELQHAIDKGTKWLEARQNPAGFWTTPEYPALTALVLTSLRGNPAALPHDKDPEFIRKGYAFLLSCAQPDGGIYKKDLYNYNTSISIMALLAANNPDYNDVILKARNYVIGCQANLKNKTGPEKMYDGGIGYGDDDHYSDLSNTVMALEALYYSKPLVQGKELTNAKDLNWPAAMGFIQRCQNLTAYNKEPWASDDPQNKGGFLYRPNDSSHAGAVTLPSGKIALRSYGSMSYDGLLSYIYADLKPDDPRVLAVQEWLRNNYSVDENPGMKKDGLYYYYHTMAKALSTSGVNRLKLKNGSTINWREDLARKLLDEQKNEGFWVNTSGRWWEKDPVLVTSYALIALEIIHRGL